MQNECAEKAKSWSRWSEFDSPSLGDAFVIHHLFLRIHEGLVDGGAALVFDHGHARAPEALNHGDKDDVVGWIDPEPSAGGAVPEKCAFAIGEIGELRIVFDGAVVAVAEAGAHVVDADAKFSRQEMRREMVGAHKLNGRRRENADSVEFPAVGEHRGKAIVVLGS